MNSHPQAKFWEQTILPLLAVGVGLLIGLLSLFFGQPVHQMLGLLFLSSCSLGLLVFIALRMRKPATDSTHPLDVPLALATDPEIFKQYQRLSKSLRKISESNDPIYRDEAMQRIHGVCFRLERVAQGTIDFEGTETWRIVYEQLLRSRAVHLYRSVALIEHENYWQDEPGRKSTQLNLDLVDERALNIERIAIIADSLWPEAERLPTENILRWLDRQHKHGIWLKLLRVSRLAKEPELSHDMGIYGSHVVGFQRNDPSTGGSTFTLKFDFTEVATAEDRWNRLSVYAVSYRDLLDQVRE